MDFPPSDTFLGNHVLVLITWFLLPSLQVYSPQQIYTPSPSQRRRRELLDFNKKVLVKDAEPVLWWSSVCPHAAVSEKVPAVSFPSGSKLCALTLP